MILERGPIKLIRITKEYIELVRQKRNLPEIQNKMEYRQYITPEMQQKWFADTNNINNHYFLIETNKIFIGLISIAEVDWKQRVIHNAGLFIWDENYMQSPEIIYAAVLLTDFCYYIGFKKNYTHVLTDNKRAIEFNTSLGYKLLPHQENVYKQKYEQIADVYFNVTKKIRHHVNLNGTINALFAKQEFPEMEKIMDIKDKIDENKVSFYFID